MGIKGYARSHLNTIRSLEAKGDDVKLWGVVAVDPSEDPTLVGELKTAGVRVFHDVDSMFAEGAGGCHIVTLPTSLPSHAALSIAAMKAGYHVYCEKPPAATVADVDAMALASKETGKACAVGFQGIFSPATQRLKGALLSGAIGTVREAKCTAFAFRPDTYYTRNHWAGRLKVGDALVLDGPINNAFAHQLQAMLYLTGREHHSCSAPQSVRAELYRARTTIESDDTGCLRIECQGGVTISAWYSHATAETNSQRIEILGTEGRATITLRDGVTLETADGTTDQFSNEGKDPSQEAFRNIADVARDDAAHPLSFAANTREFVQSISGAHASARGVHQIPGEYTRPYETDRGHGVIIPEIFATSEKALESGQLFSELGLPWSEATETHIV